MWRQLYEYAKQALSLIEETRENTAAISELRRELKETQQQFADLREDVRTLTGAVQHFAVEVQRLREHHQAEMQRLREHHQDEREKLLLRLENELLRFERRVSPGRSDDDPPALR